MKSKLWRLFPLLLIALVAGVVWVDRTKQDSGTQQTLACTDLHQGCATELDGKPVTVRIDGELKPLQAFVVHVTAPGANKVQARFTMEGMDMGFNLYTFRADKAGEFLANVTLPVCVTGRRDWVMGLSVDEDQIAVPFVTDL